MSDRLKDRLRKLEASFAGIGEKPEAKDARDARVRAFVLDPCNLPAALSGIVHDHRQAAMRAAFRADR